MWKWRIQTFPFRYKLMLAIVLTFVVFTIAIIFGAADSTLYDFASAFGILPLTDKAIMMREIRFPREVAAALVGAALGVSGAMIQGLTRNPLADPGLLGLTAGANAALAISLALIPGISYIGIMIACFIGAAVGAVLVFFVSSFHPEGYSTIRIVLAGAAISAFLYAIAQGVGLYFKIAQNVSMWTTGGLIGTTWQQVWMLLPIVILCSLIAMVFAKQLTILSLSEEVAVGLGENTNRVKFIYFLLVIFLTGASVALIGNLAFFGLMIPHIVRTFVGTDYKFVIPMSIVFGAAFMLAADTAARLLYAPYETPIIAIVSVMGLPFFLFIVRKNGGAFR